MGDGAEAPWSGCKDLKGHSTEPSCGLAYVVESACISRAIRCTVPVFAYMRDTLRAADAKLQSKTVTLLARDDTVYRRECLKMAANSVLPKGPSIAVNVTVARWWPQPPWA